MSSKSVFQATLSGSLVLLAMATLAAAPSKTASLFNGKDLSGWKKATSKSTGQWQVGQVALDPINPEKLKITGPGDALATLEKNPNLISEASFGDCILELEFMVPKKSNSGVKLVSLYEIQILDSFGKAAVGKGDCGAVYQESAPKVNACKAPGEWQTLVIDFRAPRFDAAGKKTANARFAKVTLNGQMVQENVELDHGTNVSRNKPEYPAGPLLLQGDHGPIAFRNIKLTPLS
jgi:hypothetical protein